MIDKIIEQMEVELRFYKDNYQKLVEFQSDPNNRQCTTIPTYAEFENRCKEMQSSIDRLKNGTIEMIKEIQ